MKVMYPDYTNSIVNFMASIRKFYGLSYQHNTMPKLDEVLSKDYKNIIMILLDGMGSNIISKTIGDNSFLAKKKVADFSSVFPCTTAAATTAYLSCKTPIENAWLGWHMYFKQIDNDVTLFLNQGYYNDIKYDTSITGTYIPYKSIITELNEIGVKADLINAPFINKEDKVIENQLEKVKEFIKSSDSKKFMYVYNDDPDHTIHGEGVSSKKTFKVIKKLNDALKKFYKEIDDETLVLVCADHGLVDVLEINLFGYPKILSYLKRLPSIEPRAATFYVKDGYHKEFEEEFNSLWKDEFVLLTKKEVYEKQIFGVGIPHPLVDDFIGDYLALSKGRYMFGYNEASEYDVMKATHAGLLEDEMLIPLIVLKK